jgi:hypothetical protein
VEQLAEHLAAPCGGDAEKMARVMFRWIADNVAYDVERFRQEGIVKESGDQVLRGDSQSPETVMRTGLAVCEGYAKLLCAMCDAAGVACKYIGGDAHIGGGDDDREPEGHGWNALSFDGGKSWHLCDVCWAAGSVGVASAGVESAALFSHCFTKKWWCTAPRHFVERHLPEDRGDQLLEQPASKAEWARMRDTAWTPTTFTTMNDGDEVLAPFTGVLRSGQRVEFRIFLVEDSPSTLRLQWNNSWGDKAAETLRSQRGRGGYVHSLTVQARSSGTATVHKQGPTRQTSTGTTTGYDGLAKWKVE